MTTIGLYVPGTGPLHRLPASVKLVAMVIGILAITIAVRRPWQVLPVAVIILLGYVLARIPVRTAIRQLLPMVWVLGMIAIFQTLVAGWERAVVVCGVLLLSVALAALVTLTTPVTEMLDVIERALGPLRRVGVDPERVALTLALTIRCIPLLVDIVRQVRDARWARGVGFSARGFLIPITVEAVAAAEALGDALDARSDGSHLTDSSPDPTPRDPDRPRE